MIKCESCGAVFSDYEAKPIRWNVGEAWGHQVYEDTDTCPYCGSDELEKDYVENEE